MGRGGRALDVYWRIANSALLSNTLSYDDLPANGQSLPALRADAIVVQSVHARLLACTHRAKRK